MPSIAAIKEQYPDLIDLDDEQVVDVLHENFYSSLSRADVAKALGVKPAEPKAEPRSLLRTAGDVGVSALKGAIGVPEAALGLADLATGGRAGQMAEEVGFRPKEAKAILDEQYSPQQKAAFQKVQAADGLGNTFMEAVRNPSVVAHSVVESLPSMGAGGVIARGGLALAPKVAPLVAGALGEGVVGTGAAAEQIRQGSKDGLLTPTQSGLAAATGALTTGFAMLGGKIAKKLGIADVDTMLAGATTYPAMRKGVVRSALEGAVAEGFLEELPQSISEQILQNIALDRPLEEGVNQAAVLGLLSGATMGAGGNVMSAASGPAKPAGPLARATAAVPASTIEDIAVKSAAEKAGPAPIDPADDPIAARIEELPEEVRDEARKAYAVLNNPNAAKGVQNYNKKLLDRHLSQASQEFHAKKAAETEEQSAQAAIKSIAGQTEKVDLETGEITRAFDQRQADAPKQEEGDVLNAEGKPFTNMGAAKKTARELGDGFAPIRLGTNAYVVRPKEKPAAGEWQAFAPESGTKGIPRADMPQIKAEHRGAMVNFLLARGIRADMAEEVAADTLKPTQAEFSTEKVKLAKAYEGGERSILISSDNHVLDGHHQWLNKLDSKQPVKVIRLNAPIDQLMETVKEFPSAETSAGATAKTDTPAAPVGEAKPDTAVADGAPGADAAGSADNAQDSLKKAVSPVDETPQKSENSDLKTIGAKLIPDMTDEELPRMLDFYGPTHKRTAKIQKEIDKRAAAGGEETRQQKAREERQALDVKRRAQAGTPEGLARIQAESPTPDQLIAAGALSVSEHQRDRVAKMKPAEHAEELARVKKAIDEDGERIDQYRNEGPAAMTPYDFNMAHFNEDGVESVKAGISFLAQRLRGNSSYLTALLGRDPEPTAEKGKKADKNPSKAPAGQQGSAPVAIKNVAPVVAQAESDLNNALAAIGMEAFGARTWRIETSGATEVQVKLKSESPLQIEVSTLVPSMPTVREMVDTIPAAVTAAQDLKGKVKEFLSKAAEKVASTRLKTEPVQPEDTQRITSSKAEMRPYRREDGSIGYEAVPIVDTKEPDATLRALAHKDAAAGDVKLGNGQFVTLDQAVAAAREHMTEDQWSKPFQFNNVLDIAPTDWDRMVKAMAPAKPAVASNTVFTEDAATKARAVLKAKLSGTLNSGLDPELLQAGLTLAGYHIEKGARTFAAYAKAMIADLGDEVKPYLQSWYMGIKYDPRAAAFEGMDTPAVMESVNLDKLPDDADTGGKVNGHATQQLDKSGAGALEGAPSKNVRAPGGDKQAGSSPDGGRGRDGGGDARTADAGGDPDGSLGTGEGAVPVPARGTGAGAKDAKKPRVPRTRAADEGPGLFGDAGGLTPAEGPNPAPNAPAIAAPQVKAEDFSISDELALGEGGQKTKYKNNVAAIRLLAELEKTERLATPDEQKVLAKYVGWGGVSGVFDADHKDWQKEHAELKALLSQDEWDAAARSTRYAHYTSREIIVDGIYAAMRRFGFTGGKTLEAGAGVGNFLGLMPADMRSAGRFTAIEREPFSSAIARQLYPQQNVQRADFTEFRGTDAYYDAAVGNPPFAADPQTDRSGRKHLSGLSLHNYFFAKSVDMLREGGIMAQVVTNYFLDAKADTARKYISDRVQFLGAIRLPNSAFAKNANTEVTTDIVFLQKRPDSEFGGKAAREDAKRWMTVGQHKDAKGKVVPLNQYFIDHPEMMLGEFGAHGSMYGPNHPALVAKPGQDTLAMLKAAVEKLPAAVYKSVAETGTADHTQAAITALKDPSVREGGYFMDGDKLMQRLPDLGGEARGTQVTPETQWTEKTKLGEPGFERIKSLSAMRATVRGLIAAEMADDAKTMTSLRKVLNEQYDAYRSTHGLINDPSTLRVFEDDPDFPLLASLEHGYTPGIGPAAAKRMGVKPTASTAKKGPIFSQRVVAARQKVQKVESPADALAVSMAERGKLDAAYIGELLGKEPDAVLKELSSGDAPLLFRDPATDEYVLRDAYLSGNVRAKLAQAKAAGMFGNTKALEAVQPPDVASHEISARVGSPWVPTSVYADFAQSLFGEESKADVFYLQLNSSFQLHVTGASEVSLRNTWGTPSYKGDELLQAVMNNRSIKVTYRDSEGRTHTDIEATELANTKAQEIKDRFGDWLFSDPDRSELLTRAYNETNNNYVTRVYDGGNMTFPGKVPDSVIKFRRHQRNAIARIVQDRTTLLDHVVGAGKTFTIVAGAMELKRTGLARKPMVAVPNHLVKQWAADFYRLYPGANVLTATKKDFEKGNRRKFLARIATGDWDAVVIAHSSFGFIKPAPEFEAQFNQQQVSHIMATIKAVDDSDGDKPTKKRTIKQLEAMKERLENRIKSLRDKPMDDLLDFEQIGVDQLFVDEFHMFKNLMFSTKMQNVQGLGDSAGSQRAYDMYVKISQIFAKNGRGQGVVAATGTPVSNSLAEMYHMMRYLMPAQMEELGFESFDAWANTFASVEQVWMQAPSGDGFKASNRMSNFVNTPELLKMFDQVSDTVTMADIKKAYSEENDGAEFPLPKLKGGRRTPVSLEKSPAQDAYMLEIAKRAKEIEQRRGPPKKGDDNILVVMGDARKAAMDIRLVDKDVMEREKGGRIDRATDETVARYQKYDKWKGTQIVFSDLGTPIKHAKTELKEYEALQARIQAATEEVIGQAALGNEQAAAVLEDVEAAQAEVETKGADWLGAVQAAMRGFSIYDDFKAALIEKGIPEGEIAFIHDYNTDDQKASLFRKMNAGQIRVLLGSTSKLGAGTNVQERLVAEHHLDVPWRPSDVEQREGRIERQGNILMTEIPGFEIEILAYVTKDTLDMRMWQVQETKLKMINQLRTRQIGREIDNAFEDMELSAGEMQAAATGDINLLKEIQLRNDVKKLEQKRRSFEAQRNDLLSRKKRNADKLRRLPAELETATEEASHVQAYFDDMLEKAPKFQLTIDGKEYTDANDAAAYLRELHDARVDVEGEDGKTTSKAAPLSVVINGETFKSRAGMIDAFTEVRGDTDPIAWKFNGETYRRRSKLATAIRQNVVDSIADQVVKEVGTVGDYTVAVEGEVGAKGFTTVDLTMSRGGKVVMSRDFQTQDTANVADRVVKIVENLLDSTLLEANYIKRDLENARKEEQELAKTEAAGVWPEEGKLEAARAAHKDVLGKLKQKDASKEGDAPADVAFARSTAEEKNALKQLSENDELFSLAKSDSKTVEGIVADASEGITVKKEKDVVGRTVYTFTMPDGKTATMSVRPFNPYATEEAPTLYGYTLKDGEMTGLAIERPGKSPEKAGDLDDVWVDVSKLQTGGGGQEIYNIAQTYAHNTGRIFIGDPAGLTDDALRRRTEQMLSSALKFGTTKHLAPHPRQIAGDAKLGIPALKWTYGDDLGNIESLIQTSLASYSHVNPLTFEPSTGRFLDSEGHELDGNAISLVVRGTGLGASGAGAKTLKRSAVFQSLVRAGSGEGSGARPGAGILARLVGVASQSGASTSKVFYARSTDPVAAAQSTQAVEKIVEGLTSRWDNAPAIVVAYDMADPRIPQAARDADQKLRSGGTETNPDAFFYKNKVYLLASAMGTPQKVAEKLLHESLGHYGLRGNFGDDLKPILQQLYALRRPEVVAKAKEYGLDVADEKQRLQAAEEVLAEMAQTRPEIGFVRRAIAIIRTWLRRNFPGFKNLALSDEDVIANYILPARGWVERAAGVDKEPAEMAPAFGRSNSDVGKAFNAMVKNVEQDLHGVLMNWNESELNEDKDKIVGFVGRDAFYSKGRDGGKTVVSKKEFMDWLASDAPFDTETYGPEITTDTEWAESIERLRALLPSGFSESGKSDAMFSRSLADAMNSTQDVKLPAGYIVNDFFKGDGKLSFWHKTVGTQYNLAERNPAFKKVFDGVQDFINDVSFYATDAADSAPSILPKLESWKDIGKSAISAADNKAIAAPIFEGTLTWTRGKDGQPAKMADMEAAAEKMTTDAKAQLLFKRKKITEGLLKMWQGLPIEQYEKLIEGKFEREFLKPGIVFTPAELKSLFKLTDQQVALYQEFRAATDKSLTNMAVADMIRFGGQDVAAVRDEALGMGDVDAAAVLLRDHLMEQADGSDRNEVLIDTADKMIQKADRARDLMNRGYAPLSRFGSYSLDVVDQKGDRVYFGLFESKAEANKMARQMKANFPEATVSQGTMSDEEYKLFAGVSPETLELFGEMLGLEAGGDDAGHQAFQQYLKLAKNNRSAMKRLIERKGIAGFSEDPGRVLAGFVYSNARQTSAGLHMGGITQSVRDIPKGQGELKDAAVQLLDYVKNPQEEAQKIRGLLFAQYLGGSIASAMVNLMQPLNVTFPWLSQHGGVLKAAGQMKSAVVDAMKDSTGDKALDEALKKAAEDGIVSPQEVFQLMAQAQGKATLKPGDGTLTGDALAKGSNALSKLSLAWGKVFGLAEQFNRRTTFIAAYRTAVEQKMADPAKFAERAVNETQFVYNKGAKPKWARGAVGGVLFTFKSYSINYVEMLSRMASSGPEGKKAALLALGVLFLMSGAGGLPFAEDIDDLIDGVMQRLGYNFSSKQAKQEFLTSALGRDGAQFVERGISGIAGVPIDVSGRLGMGNLIPGTGLLTKKQDHGRDMLELAGPAGDLAKRTFEAAGKLVDGNVTGRTGAVATLAPTAARNLIQAMDMANTGMYRDTTGKKVLDVDGYDVLAKAIGFQPNDVARVQDATRQVQNMIGQNKIRESEIAAQWAQGVFEQDQAKVQDARDALARWNEANPTAPIRIQMPQILKRVKAMREDKATRIAKTAPREIRATVRRELADSNE
ncbi:MAG: PLxRFG domain-containing protein [Pseudomonadota bacterium]